MKIMVTIEHGHNMLSIGEDLGEMYERCFYPLKTTDSPLMAWASGEDLCLSEEVVNMVRLRKDTAQIISETIATALVDLMKKEDTYNGYKISD